MMMNRFFVSSALILLFSICMFSQTKSIADAQNEIKTFTNSKQFSVVYDSAKYATVAEVNFDIVEPKTPFQKIFKEFTFKVTSLFSNNGIESKTSRTTLCINTRSKKFYFSSNRNLILTIDSEAITLGEADRSTEFKGGRVRENLCWEIDREIVHDLGKSATVKSLNGTTPKIRIKNAPTHSENDPRVKLIIAK